MKTNYFITMMAFIILSMVSCQKEILDEENPNLGGKETSNPPALKGINMALDWENTIGIYIPNVGSNVTLPWYAASNTTIPQDILQDYKKEDGWVLLYNFAQSPIDVGQNYLIFYNIFTGIMRSYYYMNSDVNAGTDGFWHLNIYGTSALLNNTLDYTQPINQQIVNSSVFTNNICVNPVNKAIKTGWNCFETEFTYDPNAANKSLVFGINAYNVNMSQITLNGEYNSKSSGTIVSFNKTNPANSAIDGAAKAAGDGAKSLVNKMKDNGTLSGIGGMVAGGVAGGLPGLIAGGLKFVFKSFISKKDKVTETVQKLEFKTNGTMTINGTITSSTSVNVNNVSGLPVPGTIIASNVPSDRRPFYNKALGVWNISNAPVIMVPTKCYCIGESEYPNLLFYYVKKFHVKNNSFEVKINPEVLANVKNYTIETSIICVTNAGDNSLKGSVLYKDDQTKIVRYPLLEFTSGAPINWNPNPDPTQYMEMPYIIDYNYPSGLVVNVTVTLYPKTPFKDSEIIISRQYQPTFEYDESY